MLIFTPFPLHFLRFLDVGALIILHPSRLKQCSVTIGKNGEEPNRRLTVNFVRMKSLGTWIDGWMDKWTDR